jgi:hypothetical protein
MYFTRISNYPTLLKILLYTEVPGKFSNFTDVPLLYTAALERFPASQCGPRATGGATGRNSGGSSDRVSRVWGGGGLGAHLGSPRGRSWGGSDSGELAQRRKAAVAAAAHSGEGQARPGQQATREGSVRAYEAVGSLRWSSVARVVKLGERPLMATSGGARRGRAGVQAGEEERAFCRRDGQLPSWPRLEQRGSGRARSSAVRVGAVAGGCNARVFSS